MAGGGGDFCLPSLTFFLSMEGRGVVGPAAGGQRGWRDAALDLGFCWQVTAGTAGRGLARYTTAVGIERGDVRWPGLGGVVGRL